MSTKSKSKATTEKAVAVAPAESNAVAEIVAEKAVAAKVKPAEEAVPVFSSRRVWPD